MKKLLLNTQYVSGLISLSVISILVAGCTYKSTPKNEHQAPTETVIQEENTATADDLAALNLHSIYGDLKQIESMNGNEKTAQSQKIVDALKPYILNRILIENPKHNQGDKLRSALSMFNFAFIKLVEQGQAPQDTLKTYTAIVKRGCDENLTSCQFFKTDWRSSEILVAYAEKLETNLDTAQDKVAAYNEYYGLLKMAIDIKNGVKNDKLNLLFVRRAQEYTKILGAQPDMNSRVNLSQIGKVFEVLISDIESRKNDPKVIEFIKAFKPWTYSRMQTDLFQFGTKKIFSVAAETQLYDADGKLNADFKAALEKANNETDKLGKSFVQSIQEFKAANPNVIKFLSIENIDSHSEYFFITDRLFRGHLAIDEVAEVWQAVVAKNGPAALKKLDQTIVNYLRWEFLKLVISTNEYVRNYYQKGTFDPKELIEKVIQNSRDKDEEWASLNRRADDIKNLLLRYVGSQDISNKIESIRMIESIPRNSKYMATYPNMMLLAYMLQKTDATLTINTWFGPIEIPAGIVINAFLNGGIAPWFNFSKDSSPLNQVEILIAYDYALKTDVFKSLQILDGKFKIDELDFLKSMVKSYFSEEVRLLESARNVLVDSQSNSDYSSFMSICRGETQVDLKFDDLSSIVLVGNGGSSKGLATAGLQIYDGGSGGSNPKEVLSNLNSSFQQKKVVVNILGQILKKYFLSNADGGKDEKVQKAIADTEKEVQFVKEKLAQYYKTLFGIKKSVDDCIDNLRGTEKSMVYDLLRQEKDYLGSVYEALKDIRSKSGSEKDLAIKNLLAKSSSNNKDSLEEGPSYRYSRLGFIYRTLERLQKTKFQVSVKSFPSESDLKKFDVGSLKLDLMENGNELTKEQFIHKGMQKLNAQTGSFVDWISGLNDFDMYERRIKLSVEMYQTGIMLGLPDAERLTADALLKFSAQLMNSFHIDDQEAVLLKDMGLSYKLPSSRFDSYFKKGSDPLAPFDYAFSLIKAKDDSDKGLLIAAESFYQTISGMGYFIFAPEKDLKDQLKLSYAPLVKNYEKTFKDITNAIDSCASCKKRPFVRYDLSTDATAYQGITESSEMKMLNDNNTFFFNSRMRQFHERTKDYFKN